MGPLCGPGSKGSEGSKGSKGCGTALAGDEYIAACRRQRCVLTLPPRTVILSHRRRISVPAAFETIGDKYRSAGRVVVKGS